MLRTTISAVASALLLSSPVVAQLRELAIHGSENPDLMPHNFVIAKSGSLEELGTMAEDTAQQPGAAKASALEVVSSYSRHPRVSTAYIALPSGSHTPSRLVVAADPEASATVTTSEISETSGLVCVS